MRITLATAELKRALTASEKCAPAKTTIPVCSHVLIECLPSGVRLSVTDLETGRQEMLDYSDSAANVGADWRRCVDVRALKALLPSTVKRIKAAPTVEFYTDTDADDVLRIAVGGAESMLRGLPPQDFPVLPFAPLDTGETQDRGAIPGKEYRETVAGIFSAVSTEESRFQLSGALFELNGKLCITATDGHRLHRSSTDYRVPPAGSGPGLLVPRDALDIMLRDSAFGPATRKIPTGDVYKSGPRKGEPKMKSAQVWPDVYISSTETHVYFETSRRVRYVSRILEGNMPDVDRVIKTETPDLIISTDAENLRATMASISHMTGDGARAIRMELDGELPVFSAANPDRGTSTATMNGRTAMTGRLGVWLDAKERKTREAMKPRALKRAQARDASRDRPQSLGINPDYVIEAMTGWAAESIVELHLWSSSCQMQVVRQGDPSEIRVVMPIRL